MALEDFQGLIDNLVRDDSGEISDADRDQALLLAVVRYSTDRPVQTIRQVTAAGGVFLDLPADWDLHFSRLIGLGEPDGDETRDIPAIVEDSLSGRRIRSEEDLTAGADFLVTFTEMHRVDAGADTVPIQDREAVANWAAALLLEQLATLYSGHRQPTINADSVDWQTKGRDFAARAKAKRQAYLDHLGIDPKRTVAHGVVVDFDQTPSHGRPHMIPAHGRR